MVSSQSWMSLIRELNGTMYGCLRDTCTCTSVAAREDGDDQPPSGDTVRWQTYDGR